MDLVIKALDGQTAGDPHKLNDSFLVESELTLSAEGGVIRYEVVPVPPYQEILRRRRLGRLPERP